MFCWLTYFRCSRYVINIIDINNFKKIIRAPVKYINKRFWKTRFNDTPILNLTAMNVVHVKDFKMPWLHNSKTLQLHFCHEIAITNESSCMRNRILTLNFGTTFPVLESEKPVCFCRYLVVAFFSILFCTEIFASMPHLRVFQRRHDGSSPIGPWNWLNYTISLLTIKFIFHPAFHSIRKWACFTEITGFTPGLRYNFSVIFCKEPNSPLKTTLHSWGNLVTRISS